MLVAARLLLPCGQLAPLHPQLVGNQAFVPMQDHRCEKSVCSSIFFVLTKVRDILSFTPQLLFEDNHLLVVENR